MTIQINVTAEDIKNGEPRNRSLCPIALAAQRVFQCPVQVLRASILVEEHDGPVRYYHLPEIAMEFVATVDTTKLPAMLKPFTFSIKDL